MIDYKKNSIIQDFEFSKIPKLTQETPIGKNWTKCTYMHCVTPGGNFMNQNVILLHLPIAYEEGATLGADYIECDVQITKDLQLICSHEAWIKDVCNVEDFPQFADRLTTYNMDDDDPDFDWNDKGQGGSLHQIGLKRNCTM